MTLTNKIHISQFYAISKVTTGSELYYICEIGRYLKNRGMIVSLEGVFIESLVKNSQYWDYFRYAVDNDYVCDVNIKDENFTIRGEYDFNISRIFTTDLSEDGKRPVFTSYGEGDTWLWTLGGTCEYDRIHHTKIINGTNRSQALTSLVASVAVNRLLTGTPKTLILDLSSEVVDIEDAVCDLMLLDCKTDALNGWVTLNIEGDLTKLSYDAWVYEAMDKGFMREFVPTTKKIKYFKENGFGVGDVVLLYHRSSGTSRRAISNCKIAVIKNVDRNRILLEVINTKETRLAVTKRYEALDDDVKMLYLGDSYLRFEKTTLPLDWLDFGVDVMLYQEDYFITDLNRDDSVGVWLDNDSEEAYIEMDAVEAIYSILKDREVDFNEERYISKYYEDGKIPVYTRFMRGELD